MKYVDEVFNMLNEDIIFRDRSRRNEVRSLDEIEVLLNGWVAMLIYPQ